MIWNTTIGLLVPLLGTMIGAAVAFFIKGDDLDERIKKSFLGFASGVMIAASFWGLLSPALEMAEEATSRFPTWFPPTVGFLAGIFFLLLLDHLLPHLHLDSDTPEGTKVSFRKSTMLVMAITLHNIPEGMAVGVIFAGFLSGEAGITLAGAMSLSIGIALQNAPETAITTLPLRAAGVGRRRSFVYGSLTGVVEPIAAVITILLTTQMVPLFPYLLSFAAGAMIYVVIEELIPEAQAGAHSNIGTITAALGFVFMMVLDVALG